MTAELKIQLLGGFSVSRGGAPFTFPTRKSEALLAFLAFSPGQTHSREKLATLLWPDSGDNQARQSLRQTLFTVKRELPDPDALLTDSGRIALAENAAEIDLVALRSLVDSASVDDLRRAHSLYTGPLLDGFSTGEDEYDLWVEREREALRERISAARDRLISLVGAAEPDFAIQVALAVLTEDPVRESAHRALIRIYADTGRRAAAVKQYNNCADILWRRLTVRPSRETRELYESIAGDPTGADEEPRRKPEQMEPRRSSATHILVVEDNPLNQEVIKAALTGPKYEVTVVDDGAAALMELGRRQFDLALVDIELPYVNGLTLIDAIKDNGVVLPLIVLTSHQETEHEVSALSRGADDYLRKPIQKDVLLMRIDRVLRARGNSATS